MAAEEKMEIAVDEIVIKQEIVEEVEENATKTNVLVSEHEIMEQKMDWTNSANQKSASDMTGKDHLESSSLKKEPIIKVFEKEKGIVQISMQDAANDEEDETILMTPDEVRDYLQQKIAEYISDVKVNPLLALNAQFLELQEEFKEKSEEYVKLNKLFDAMNRNQEKFLRHNGIMTKTSTSTIGISVDLPLLPNSVPPLTTEKLDSVPGKSARPPDTKLAPAAAEAADKLSKPPPKPAPEPGIECIDLTDDTEPAKGAPDLSKLSHLTVVKHPAPLPPKPFCLPNKDLPSTAPKPRLSVSAEERGIVLQWDMPPSTPSGQHYAPVNTFDIFGYQEQRNVTINTLLWKKIGGVRAMSLPMACTLTQFVEGNKYHFAIRAVDVHGRTGAFSDPISIVYKQASKS